MSAEQLPLAAVTLAIDHVKAMRACVAGELSAVDLGVIKCRLAAAGEGSVLTDPEHDLAGVRDRLGPGRSLVVSIEDGDYAEPDRQPRMLPGWDVARVAAAGADMVKCFFWYRPGAEGGRARQFLSNVAAECRAADIALLAEPILIARPGESEAERTELLLETVRELTAHDVTALKLQYPAVARTEEAVATCARITSASTVPWYLLSQGVPFAEFRAQLVSAISGGAAGCVVGRAVWGDLVSAAGLDADGRECLRRRLSELDHIVAANQPPDPINAITETHADKHAEREK